jgi:hypothetical protein
MQGLKLRNQSPFSVSLGGHAGALFLPMGGLNGKQREGESSRIISFVATKSRFYLRVYGRMKPSLF